MHSIRTKKRIRTLMLLFVIGVVWLFVLLKLGVWRGTIKPADGVLTNTFKGWSEYPIGRHLFLAQYEPDSLARGAAYSSYTYPTLFFLFLLVAPLHFFLKVPFEVAQNSIPYFYVFLLTCLLVLTRRHQLKTLLQSNSPLMWILAFVSIGIFVTDPLPWVAQLNYNADNLFVLVAGVFCYLSTWVFHDKAPDKPLLIAGIFLALLLPIAIPAWILAVLFFSPTLIVERKWIIRVLGVSALAGLNFELPTYVGYWGGVSATGSGFLYRSGLDGSRQYMTSIYQAIVSPITHRQWPTIFYFLIAGLLGVALHYLLRKHKQYRPLKQAGFLLIPYSTIVILFPQFTSIHPYLADPLLVIPAIFLMVFWSLQKEFWESLTARTYVLWLLVAGLIVMTNLLTVAQNLKAGF